MKTVGISPKRVQLFHCSAAEGQRFQQEATRISEEIQNLGSNPLKKSKTSDKEGLDLKNSSDQKTE
ncbi:MAG TPA: hydrogenase iron-sulfur subunit [archaeon]|nr:hydrogenase iron-sulfur subunit [archaeon]